MRFIGAPNNRKMTLFLLLVRSKEAVRNDIFFMECAVVRTNNGLRAKIIVVVTLNNLTQKLYVFSVIVLNDEKMNNRNNAHTFDYFTLILALLPYLYFVLL